MSLIMNSATLMTSQVEYTKLPAEEDTDGIGGANNIPPPNWPAGMDGSIEVSGLRLWYEAGLPDVLSGLDFKIKSGEKVGVIGRTGAGKSSMLAAILRLAPTSGVVKIAGVPTNTLPLKTLRRYVFVDL
jgi:ATP-binding cassette subfamily C (CFTR/MRP) protein 4